MVANTLALDLTCDVLESEAPEELLLIDSFDPGISYDGRTGSGPQGFGAETVVVVILPFIYRFFEKMVDRAASRTADATYDALKGWLSGADLGGDVELETAVKRELASMGMPDAQAEEVSCAVLKSLRKKRALFAAAPNGKGGGLCTP